MYRGFNLQLQNFKSDKWYGIGLERSNIHRQSAGKDLSALLNEGTGIDGTAMQESWFPQIKADVFISHSHQDQQMAITLAGWLKDAFKLTAFVDSSIWDNSRMLQKEIDKKYCLNPDAQTYNYEKRNQSTSHVNVMLMSALMKMINQSECLIFLNTPQSIQVNDIQQNVNTSSPWIYGEINAFNLIRKRLPYRNVDHFEKALTESEMKVLYELDLAQLVDLDYSSLTRWFNAAKASPRKHSLDVLYETFPYEIL